MAPEGMGTKGGQQLYSNYYYLQTRVCNPHFLGLFTRWEGVYQKLSENRVKKLAGFPAHVHHFTTGGKVIALEKG